MVCGLFSSIKVLHIIYNVSIHPFGKKHRPHEVVIETLLFVALFSIFSPLDCDILIRESFSFSIKVDLIWF